ncbi:MAG: ExbD/TolR family protein [Verrucomicrobiia bacterium]
MRLPRNAKIFRGQLDAAPFAGVMFLLLLFVVLQSKLVFTPGIPIDLPKADADLPGIPGPSVIVAVDRSGQVYYESQAVANLGDLRDRLRAAVRQSRQPLTLEVMVDKSAPLAYWVPVLSLAGEAGMDRALLVTRPQIAPIREPAL